jgi:SPP1 gp7 family putative phage head morphogenesis protein
MPTAAQLAQRRALVAAAQKRHPPKQAPPAQLPRPTAYTRALTAIADELNAEVLAALADVGIPTPRTDAADGDAGAMPAFSKADLWARLRRIAEGIVKRRGSFIDTAIEACAANVANVSREQWARQAKAIVGIDLSKVEPNLTPTINAFRRANVELITTMARDKVERVKVLLTEHAGARVETIRDKIMEEGGVTKRQAALIARDQVLSLNAQVTEKRHVAAGVTKYTWRTSGDGDVRPAHRALNGKVFAYADPPVVDAKRGRRENPGQDYQCRCTAEPVIEWGEEDEVPVEKIGGVAPPSRAAAQSRRASPPPIDDPDEGPVTVSARDMPGRPIPSRP